MSSREMAATRPSVGHRVGAAADPVGGCPREAQPKPRCRAGCRAPCHRAPRASMPAARPGAAAGLLAAGQRPAGREQLTAEAEAR